MSTALGPPVARGCAELQRSRTTPALAASVYPSTLHRPLAANMERAAPSFAMTGIFLEGKQKFLEELNKINNITGFRTEDCIYNKMAEIKRNPGVISPYVIDANKYGTLLKKKMIISGKERPYQALVKVIPDDFVYEVVMNAHVIFRHVGCRDLYDVLKIAYCIPIQYIQLVLNTCEICSTPILERPHLKIRGIGTWNLIVIDVNEIPYISNPLNCMVLAAIDTETEFIIIRQFPIKKEDNEETVEVDFKEIFPFYGYPEKMYVMNTYIHKYFAGPTWGGNKVTPDVSIANDMTPKTFLTDEELRDTFVTWASISPCSSLDVLCVEIQHFFNTTNGSVEGGSQNENRFPEKLFYDRKLMWERYYTGLMY